MWKLQTKHMVFLVKSKESNDSYCIHQKCYIDVEESSLDKAVSCVRET